MEKEPRSICPVCGSYNKGSDKQYNVKYNKNKGKCFNPLCQAEWTIRFPNITCKWKV